MVFFHCLRKYIPISVFQTPIKDIVAPFSA